MATAPKAPVAPATKNTVQMEEVFVAVNDIYTGYKDGKGKVVRITIEGGQPVPDELADETKANLIAKELVVKKMVEVK